MANIFAITTVADDLKADAAGKASGILTVTNTSNKPVRGIARAKALGNTEQVWLEVEGETERDFGAGGTQQFVVNFNRPAASAAAAGKFPFRLDVASAANPDEEFTEGPTVTVQTVPQAQPAKKAFPWWILLIIGGVVILAGGTILFFVLRGKPMPVMAGTWVMTTKPSSKTWFIGTMQIAQSPEGRLRARIWKVGDNKDTGAALMTVDGQITDQVATLEGKLEKENAPIKIQCTLEGDKLVVHTTMRSANNQNIDDTETLSKFGSNSELAKAAAAPTSAASPTPAAATPAPSLSPAVGVSGTWRSTEPISEKTPFTQANFKQDGNSFEIDLFGEDAEKPLIGPCKGTVASNGIGKAECRREGAAPIQSLARNAAEKEMEKEITTKITIQLLGSDKLSVHVVESRQEFLPRNGDVRDIVKSEGAFRKVDQVFTR